MLPVAATGLGLVINRGPACAPLEALAASPRPPKDTDDRPQQDRIILVPAGGGPSRVVADGAVAHQAVAGHLIFSQAEGREIVVRKVPLTPRK